MHLDKQFTPIAFGQHLTLVNNANAPTFMLIRNYLNIHSLWHCPTRKKFPYYFYVYFEGCSLAEKPQQGVLLGELFQLNMFPPSNRNIPFLRNGKLMRKYKATCLLKGRFLYSCVFLSFGNILSSAPPLGKHTSTTTSPTNEII